MKLAVRVSGVEVLRRKMANVADCSISGTITRRGLSQVGQIVTRAQKNLAPVRKGRIQARKLDKLLKKGVPVGKATKRASVEVVKTRKATGDIIKPGLVRRSIGYRVKRFKTNGITNFAVIMGMNVGKKRSNKNFAPHAAFVGVGTKQRFSNKFKSDTIGPLRKNRGVMPQNRFIANATRFASAAAIAALDKAVKEDTVRAYNLSLRASRTFEGAGV